MATLGRFSPACLVEIAIPELPRKPNVTRSRLNRQAVLRSVGVATRCDGHSPAAEIDLRSPCKRDGATAQLARLSPDRRRLLPRRARSGFCRPNGEPHLMVARGTPIDPNSCVASLRKPFDARDFHHFTARHAGLSVEPGTSRRSNADIACPCANAATVLKATLLG